MTLEGLRTERLLLRRWRDEDRPVFHCLNSDEAVMAFFPFRRTRAESDAAMDLWNESLERTGLQFLAAERQVDGAVVGMIGLGGVEGAGYPFAPTVQIGWRLLPEVHGVGLATEGARACLRHAFERLDLPEVVSYCVVENRASEAVMRRIGLRLAGRFDHPSVDPQTHPHLVRHTLTRITAEEWRAANG